MRILDAGDAAIVIELGDAIDPAVNQRIHDLRRLIEQQGVAGIVELVPTYRSLLVYYDPSRTARSDLVHLIQELAMRRADTSRPPARIVEFPTSYGSDFGPDLGYVAEHARLQPEEVIRIHSGTDYLVYMMGFTAGFPYLGGMSADIATPRLATPRTRIPAGSVGIAQRQTGIYPADSPGGWQIIGRTPLRIFDPARTPPVIIEAGDYVRFVPVAMDEYRDIERQAERGTYSLSVRMKPART
jgi:KipI family sensor histidine kinase inhibitor